VDPLERVQRYLRKGDVPGHEFHGNQYSGGQSGGAERPPKPRMGENADEVFRAFKTAAMGGVVDSRYGILYPVARHPGGGPTYTFQGSGKLGIAGDNGMSVRDATAAEENEFHSDLGHDRLWIYTQTRPGYGSGGKAQRMLTELHSPSGNDFAHRKAVDAHLRKGDVPGHEFHGNQWTGGQGGGKGDMSEGYKMSPADIPRAPARDVPDGEAGKRFREVEDRFANEIAHVGVDAMLARYAAIKEPDDTKGGRIINTDTFRELSPDYRADRSNSSAVHEPASYLAKIALARAIAALPVSGLAVFTAGGSGAGKSSGLDARRAEEVIAKFLGGTL
jgi:hypothetical protein